MACRRVVLFYLWAIVGCSDDGAGAIASASGSTSTAADATATATDPTSGPAADSTTAPGETTPDSSGESTTSSGESTASSGESTSSQAESSSTAAGESSSSSAGSSTTDAAESSTGNPDGLPNGSNCDVDTDCASNSCFTVGVLGGYCGECEADTDCDAGGCSVPVALGTPPEGAACNDGSLGDGCDTDAACADALVCSTILDVPGIITNETCGECVVDLDCGPAEVCSPIYDLRAIGGAWTCAGEGSLPNGAGCRLDGLGPAACASGICTAADVYGLVQLGVCGECAFDIECVGGQTCQPPEVDLMMGLSGSFCG